MACMIPVGSIYLQASSCRWGSWKPRSHSFVGPTMRTVCNRTVSSAAAGPLLKPPPSFGKMSLNFYSPLDKKVTRVLNKRRSSSIGSEGEEGEEESVSSAAVPLLMLPPSIEDSGGKMSFNFLNPVDEKVTRLNKLRSSIGEGEEELIRLMESAVLVGCSHGWLALRKGKGHSNYDLFLYNPISDRIIKLPPVETIPHSGRPDKVILSCPPMEEEEDSSDSDSSSKSSSCSAILLYGPRGNVAVCCPGLSTEWTPFGAPFHENDEVNVFFRKARIVRRYEDFVYSTRRKQLFCVTGYMDLEAWDIGDPLCPKLNWKENIDDDFEYDDKNYPWHARTRLDADMKRHICKELTRLVFSEYADRLFLVQKYFVEPNDSTPYMTVGFEVHEIIREEGGGGGELRFMDGTLDGMSLFVSDAHAFVVESPCTMDLLPNSIYCTDPNENGKGVRYLVIFDYQKESLYLCDPNENVTERVFDTSPRPDMLDHDPVPTPMWFTTSPIP